MHLAVIIWKSPCDSMLSTFLVFCLSVMIRGETGVCFYDIWLNETLVLFAL